MVLQCDQFRARSSRVDTRDYAVRGLSGHLSTARDSAIGAISFGVPGRSKDDYNAVDEGVYVGGPRIQGAQTHGALQRHLSGACDFLASVPQLIVMDALQQITSRGPIGRSCYAQCNLRLQIGGRCDFHSLVSSQIRAKLRDASASL